MRKAIKSRMEKGNISQNILASEIGVSVGVINKLLQGKEISFDICWKIVKYLEFENRNELLGKYMPELTNKKNIKYAMEYYSLNGMHDQLTKLFDLCKNGNAELKEWARIYAILQKFQKSIYKSIDPDEIVRHLRRIDSPFKETKVSIYVFEIYTLYYLNHFKELYKLLIDLYQDIMEIEDSFLRKCYYARVDEVMCHLELRYKNNPEEARLYSRRLMDNDIAPTTNSTAHFITGLSYLLNDFEKCVYHYKKSQDHYIKVNRQDVVASINEDIEIAHILWDKEMDFSTDYTSTLYKVKKGLIEADKLNSFMSETREPWIYLIKGMACNDNLLLMSSFMKFRKKDDNFLSNFPKIELIKRGKNEEILNML